MAKRRNKRLAEGFIAGLTEPGIHGDGRGGFGLQIRAHRTVAGHVTKSWRQQLRIGGKVTQLGLGRWPLVSLQEARALAMENAAAVYRGQDPRKSTKPASIAPAAVPAPVPAATFADIFAEVMDLNNLSPSTVRTYTRSFKALPARFRRADVAAIAPAEVLAVLRPTWNTQPGKAQSTLATLSKVFTYAVGAGLIEVSPVARVAKALPKQRRKTHQRAVSVADAPGAVAELFRSGETATQRLEALSAVLVALTASRPGEVTGADWSEIDGDTWTVPGSRMKTNRPHRVPLSAAVVAVLDRVAKLTGKRSGPIFPNRKGNPIDRNRPVTAMKRAGIEATAHGWRSTFETWAAENRVPREVYEACVAHVVRGVEAAYMRSDRLEVRREVMTRWAIYCVALAGNPNIR